MPVILRNSTSSIEIDIDPVRKYNLIKGTFDVFQEDTGIEGTPMIYIILRSNAMINNVIKLDWRDAYIMPGEIMFESAEQLKSKLLEWNLESRSTNSVVTKVDSSTDDHKLLDTNAGRKMAMIYNNSTKNLYIKYGEGATADSFTVKLTPGSYFEMPYPCYTGQINGFWDDVNGNVMITECT